MRYLVLVLCLLAGVASADCPKCVDGLVGTGPVKAVCPWCEGVPLGKLPVLSNRTPAADAANTPGDHRKAVVRIVVAQGPSTSRGSGVVVSHNGKPLVLTAWHVVRTNTSRHVPVVHFQDGTHSTGRVVKSSDAWDVAAIECDRYGADPVRLAGSPKDGDWLSIAGYGPHPSTFRHVRGRLVGRGRPTREHPVDFIEVSVVARQGDSGGPIFTDAGEVAGILWGSTDAVTLGTHSGRLLAFLDGAAEGSAAVAKSCPNGRCVKP